MRNPNGIRAESLRTPNASRAGALHSHIHIHSHRQNRVACDSIHRHSVKASCADAWMAADAAIGGGR